MAGYGAPPGGFGQAPSYGNFQGAPGMGPPPSFGGAPGMAPPPGMGAAQSPQPGRPNGIPSQFQPPANMPNINFNAPVIRMGTSQGKPAAPMGGGYEDRRGGGDYDRGNRGRTGLGADSGRPPREDRMLNPPVKEEVARTIFVGGLVEGSPTDDIIIQLLDAGHGLRNWSRVLDADGKPCDFGFAEYEDAASLEVATKVFEDVELPLTRKATTGEDDKNGEDVVKKTKVIVVVDPASQEYIKMWAKQEETVLNFKVDGAREELSRHIANLAIAPTVTNGAAMDGEGDHTMENGAQAADAEVINIPAAAAEDELSDIPAEMREMVAAEIAAFRDRSVKRDMERMRQEEEMEKRERDRSLAGSRYSRLEAPVAAVPTGPSGVNSIPAGPRERTVPGAPVGPKGYRGAQLPKDYVDGVAFVNGNAEEDEDDSASDGELERRRKAKRDEELEKIYFEREKKWMRQEKAHFAAVERQQKEEESAAATKDARRAELAEQLKSLAEDPEKSKRHLYHKDRRAWLGSRKIFRREEERRDARDRRDEQRELEAEQRKIDIAKGMADDFLAQQAEEMEKRQVPAKAAFSLNIGGARGAASNGAPIKREDDDEEDEPAGKQRMARIEGLLDDEDDNAAAGLASGGDRKKLKPISISNRMTADEIAEASQQLARDIPNNKEELFAWNVKWSDLPGDFIVKTLRPYVEKKIMQALGVQEELLVDIVAEIVETHGSPDNLVHELSMLDEEAEDLARKVWRMVIFFTESQARGLNQQPIDAE